MKNRPPLIIALLCALSIFTSAYSQTTYNFYFGENHSHTWYSDGGVDQTPNSSYPLPVANGIIWARNHRSSFDFLGISDHNHNEGTNMTLARWRSGIREADSVNQDGNFIGLYGQEWGTISTGGHILLYGTDKLFGWNPGVYDVYIAKGDYAKLWDSVKAHNGYCYLAHPNSADFGSLASLAYNAKADSVIRGVAVKSGKAMSTNTTEADPSTSDNTSYFHTLLAKGYHLAPVGNQDNHYTTFGRSNQQRTGLLAPSLTKVNVDNAFRNRRVYATEDHNLQVRFEVGTHQMGEIFSMSGPIPIRVKVSDPDGETFSRVEIRYGIPGSGTAPTTLQYVTNSDSLVFSQTQSAGTTYYYYAYVVESDGHRAWSAPMWITISSSPPPLAFALLAPANASADQPVTGTIRWQASSGATSYDVYLGTTNPPTTKVSSSQIDTFYSYSGLNNNTLYYWKITAKNSGGSTDATESPWNFTTIQAPPASFNLLSPSNGSAGQPVSGTLSWQASTNATGYDVYLGTVNPPTAKVSSSQAGTSYNYSGLSNNAVYYWKVVARNALDSATAPGSPWNLATVMAPPTSFNLLSPSNGSAGQPVSGTLSWQASANATGYDVYLGTVNPPTAKVSSGQAGTSLNYSGLGNNTIYYWKVIARNAADSATAAGSPWNFRTMIAPPSSFYLTSPESSAADQPVSGTLSWQSSPNATRYDVYLGTSNLPTVKVSSDQAGTAFDYTDLSYSTAYYWNVIAKNDLDSTGATNAPRSFTTAVAPPALFSLTAPANGGIGQLLTGTLRWGRSLNASVYDIYLGTGNPPVAKVDSNLTDTTYGYSNLSPDSTYYWTVVAKNGNGSVSAVGAPWRFATAWLPHAPSNVMISDVSASSLEIHWTDNATQELGYRVYRSLSEAGPYSQITGDLAPNTVFFVDSLLSINQRYYYYIVPFNELGEGAPTWIDAATLANLPGEPFVTNVQLHSLTVTVVPNGNPVQTQFAISLTSATVGCLQADGTVGIDPAWRTYSEWGGSGGILVSGLSSCHTYTISVRARNLDTLETADASATAATMLCNEISLSVSEGWNLISVPVKVSDNRTSMLFPTAQSSAYSFNETYTAADRLESGAGYWIKFRSGENFSMPGDYKSRDTIQLAEGWNIIGSISSPVDIQMISTDPADIVISNFYAYENGYFVGDSIYPGKGYWVKVSQPGQLILSSGGLGLMATRIRIVPTSELPPPPPSGSDEVDELPKEYNLYQAYPNPFNPAATIRYGLPNSAYVTLSVFNMLGEQVELLVNGQQDAGYYEVKFNAEKLSSGIYFYRMQAGDFKQSNKLLLLK